MGLFAYLRSLKIKFWSKFLGRWNFCFKQYLYVYRGFVEYLIRKGVTRRMDVLKFITDYDNLIKRKKTREQEKDMSAFVGAGRSKDYTPSVYYNPYSFY
ncbi:hypothetical protein ANCCAN_00519 [Ancylostoma caninum]|uniref:Uncharacterized protein n=1 Tax=Ancylostoma caninum TaxID=29170 RepID=A0A368HA43_ANCCA|nr:hypothetical protein ANCCAN_00519 [Ancylostoma caninum]